MQNAIHTMNLDLTKHNPYLNKYKLGERPEYAYRSRNSFNSSIRRYTSNYCAKNYDPNKLASMREILAVSRDYDLQLTLFISPFHSRLIDVFHRCGLFKDFLQWKRDLVELLSKQYGIADYGRPVLWDFSGYNSITGEAIPRRGAIDRMNWHADASHFSKETGDLMIATMFDAPNRRAAHQDFGTIIDRENIAE